MRVFTKLTTTELRLLMREPLAAFFALLFPTVLVVILGSIPAFRVSTPDLGGLRVIDLYVPIAVALVIAMLGLQGTPAVLATYREKGILRRLATTPVRPLLLLAALGVFAIGLFIAAVAPSGKAGNAIGTLLFFPSMFFAGLWTPRKVMPSVIQRIGDFTPLGAARLFRWS